MSKELDEIWAKIEEQRANYESIIAKANETIDEANALKKSAREGLDALPVAKVRRARKMVVQALADAEHMGAYEFPEVEGVDE